MTLDDLLEGGVGIEIGGIFGEILNWLWPYFMQVPFLVSIWEKLFGGNN